MATKEEIKAFIENGLNTVSGLLEEEKYVEAAKGCQEILEISPRNKTARKFLATAQKFLQKEKDEIFKKNLPKAKELYKAGEYEKALGIAEELWPIKKSNKLASLITKSRKKIQEQQVNELKAYRKKAFKTHKALTKEQKWLEAIELMEQLITVDRRNEKVREFIKRDKIKYIDHELKSKVKKTLLAEGKYDELYGFFKKLYDVFPEHKKLKKEITKTEKLIHKKTIKDKLEFIKKSVVETEKLLAEGQFDKAIQAAKEMLQYTEGESLKAKSILKKATEANQKDTEAKLKTKLAEILPALEAEFKANPKAFIKI